VDEEMFAASTPAGTEPPVGPLAFDCPRCGEPVESTYWGPCAGCREELVVTLSRDGRHVEREAYEPKMNVVPNQVATKD
jgi:hypothetical protein